MANVEDAKKSIGAALSELAPPQKREALLAAIKAQPVSDQEAIANQAAAVLPPPRNEMIDRIWLLVVGSFCLIAVGAFLAIAVAMFSGRHEKGPTPELVLTMFTTVVAFLAGLFVPSPVATKTSGAKDDDKPVIPGAGGAK